MFLFYFRVIFAAMGLAFEIGFFENESSQQFNQIMVGSVMGEQCT